MLKCACTNLHLLFAKLHDTRISFPPRTAIAMSTMWFTLYKYIATFWWQIKVAASKIYSYRFAVNAIRNWWNFTARENGFHYRSGCEGGSLSIRKKSCGNLSLGESFESSIYVCSRRIRRNACNARNAVETPCARFASMLPATFVSVSPSLSLVEHCVCSPSEKRRTATQNPYATTRAVVYITAVPIPPGIVSLNFDLLCHATCEHRRSLAPITLSLIINVSMLNESILVRLI